MEILFPNFPFLFWIELPALFESPRSFHIGIQFRQAILDTFRLPEAADRENIRLTSNSTKSQLQFQPDFVLLSRAWQKAHVTSRLKLERELVFRCMEQVESKRIREFTEKHRKYTAEVFPNNKYSQAD